LLFHFRNKYDERLSLGAKERVWSRIKGKKDLKYDLELIEDINMKILCKNMRRGRAGQRRGHATKVIKVIAQVRSLARSVLPVAWPCATVYALLLLLSRLLARPVPRFQLPFLAYF